MRGLVATLLLVSFPAFAVAQKHCKKGIPCGNTCIAANKTCHVASTPQPAATAAQSGAARKSESPAPDSASGSWVASTRGHTYYRVGCSGASKLSSANRIYFKTEADAKKAGLTRSTQKGC
jgi:hypothetical protein